MLVVVKILDDILATGENAAVRKFAANLEKKLISVRFSMDLVKFGFMS